MKKYRKGVFIVVYFLENKIPKYLILKRKLHWKGYEFPKGGVKFLETKKHAVKRELYEETGLKFINIKNHKLKGKYSYEKELTDRRGIHGQTFVLFSVCVKKGKIRLDKNEHSGFEWLNFSKSLKKLTYSDQKKCLKFVNDWIKENT
ncbi:MAG: NUDIX domain-containing protein [Candidatus Pacearchaeota archaeon]|jgi:8-oxo-dGTP pyrophosphatase MutT (NUDIX family)